MSPIPAAFSLSAFVEASPSPYQAVAAARAFLAGLGAQPLRTDRKWRLEPGGLYWLEPTPRSLAAFRLPSGEPRGFRIAAAHSDSPCLRLRERSARWEEGLLLTGCEVYGGAIHASWLDRSLRAAGCASLARDGGAAVLPVELDARLVVPNLAIHLNRDLNKGFEYNPHQHLRAVAALDPAWRERPWEAAAAAALAARGEPTRVEDILALELCLADAQPPQLLGGELINAPRLDNLAGCHAALAALAAAAPDAHAAQLACLFDHEEVGSRSQGGADSAGLPRLLRRIALGLGLAGEEDFLIALERSCVASVDAAHALHPNFPERHDPAYAPRLNGGPALKTNANQRYATGPAGAARFAALCAGRSIPLQRFSNRADAACGSTIGPALSALAGVAAVDVGIPLLAMHSCRETAGLRDQAAMVEALAAFLEEM